MAITYGMSVKEFWEDDPNLFWAYRFSYFNRVKDSQELFNQNAWLQGAYFYEGLSVALANTLSKASLKYPSKPYGNNEVERKEKINMQVADIKARIKQVNKIRSTS